MTDSSAVTGASLGRLSPIIRPAAMTLLPAARVWADEEWERIKLGYRARSMDEKWNVFVDGNVAFLHRSWTGHAVFEATFSRVDRGWRISAAVAESHPKRAAKVSPQLNRVLLELVLSAIVLGEPGADLRAELVLLSRPDDHPAPPEGLIEHSILGLRSEP